MTKRLVIIAVALAILGAGAFLGIRHLRNSPEARFKRAERYFEEGKFQEARIEYLNVLRKDPKYSGALAQIATTWTEQGAPFSAIQFLVAAVDQDPDDPELRQTLAETWLELGQFAAARKEALQVLEKNPTNEQAILLVARLSFGEEPMAEAKRHLDALDPEKSVYYHLASAVLANRRGKPEAFKSALEAALKLDPKSADVQLAWADYYRIANDQPAQRDALKAAADLSPARSEARVRYAGYLAEQKDTAEAIAVLTAVLEEADDYFPAMLMLSDLHRQAKEYDKALGLLERVLASDGANANASWMKAQVFLDQREREKAVEVLEQLDARTKFPLTKFNLARLYLGDQDLSKARDKLKEALAVNPNYTQAALLLAQIEMRTAENGQATARLEALLKAEPGNLQAKLLLAKAYEIDGRLDNAAEVFRGMAAANPKSAGAHASLGRILILQKNLDEARLSFGEAQKLAPEEQSITLALIDLDLQKKDFDSAHARVKVHLDREESWTALFLKGRILAAEAKWEEARATLFEALELNPGSIPIYSNIVGTYLAEKKPEEAIAELNKLIEKNPQSLRHRLLLAILYEQAADIPNAVAAYESVTKDFPKFVPAINNLAYLYAEKLDDLEKAETLARKAHELAGETAAVSDTLGWILYRRGKYAEALPLVESAAEGLAENQEVQYHLGMARLKMGLSEKAEPALAFAAAGDATYPGKEVAQRELAALRDPARRTEGQTVEQLEALLGQNPNDAATRLKLAQLHEKQGAFESAAEAYEAVTKVNPRLPEAWMGLARVSGGPLKKFDQAIEAGLKARRLDRSDSAIAALLGGLYLQRSAKGDLPLAYDLLWEASKKQDSPQFRHDYGRAAYLHGRLGEAREAMQALQKSSPDDPLAQDAESFLALTSPGEGGWKALAPVAEKRLTEDAQDIPALMVQARLDPDQALGIYQKLLERAPDFVLAKMRLAALYARDPKSLQEAEDLVRELLATHSDDAELARVRGAIAFRKGDAKSAIQMLEKSRETTALDGEGLFYLGMAELKDGRSAQGGTTLREALRADLDPGLEKEARTTLGLGGQ